MARLRTSWHFEDCLSAAGSAETQDERRREILRGKSSEEVTQTESLT